MKKIAITGGIGSGKSVVVDHLRKQGYSVFSCDEIYKEIIDLPAYIEKVQEEFADAVFEGKINRRKLAEIVFSNAEKREKLNAIAHPIIMNKLQKDMQSVQDFAVFAEVPLLFECGYEDLFDEIIVVTRNVNERIASICNRDRVKPIDALHRINAQVDYDNPSFLSNVHKKIYVLSNDDDISALQNRIYNVIKHIRET